MLEKTVHSATEKEASCKGCLSGKLGSYTGLICSDEEKLEPVFCDTQRKKVMTCFRLPGVLLAHELALIV